MNYIKPINEWFDFLRSKDEKEGDDVIDSIIGGIEMENPKIDIQDSETDNNHHQIIWRGKIYTFSLDKLVGYDDETIIVKYLRGPFSITRKNFPIKKSVVISGHSISFSDRKFNKLMKTLSDLIEKPTKTEKSSIVDRLKFYKSDGE